MTSIKLFDEGTLSLVEDIFKSCLLTQRKLGETMLAWHGACEIGYDGTMKSYDNFFKKEGIIVPIDLNDFFDYLAILFPFEPASFIIEATRTPHYYKQFHEYKERLLNDPNWSEQQEFDRVHNQNVQRVQNITTNAKYYALYYWILISIGKEARPNKNERDQWVKKEIKNYAENKFPNISAESFYKTFKDIDYTNKNQIRNYFGEGFKETIKTIANNSYEVIQELRDFPE